MTRNVKSLIGAETVPLHFTLEIGGFIDQSSLNG